VYDRNMDAVMKPDISVIPDVSVVMAAYNVEAYVERAIVSALDQEGVSVEVLVANDASTDRTASIVASIRDPRVHLINQPKNGGASTARNAGIAAASAPWIAILDGDDAFLPGRLRRCLDTAKQMQADIVVDNQIKRFEEDGSEQPMYPSEWFARLGTLDLTRFIYNNRTILGGRSLGYVKPLISRDFLRAHDLRYDPDIRIIEDYFLMAKALAVGARCVVEPEFGYSYTVRPGSISHRVTLADILKFAEWDSRFVAAHVRSPDAIEAQKLRTRDFERAEVFMRLVEAIKDRNITGALSAAASDPVAALNLWRPVEARARRLLQAVVRR
jgi:succinoglycan biosynthesis protein ExoO